MNELVKSGTGYTYKGFYITKAKKASITGFSCTKVQTLYPLKLKDLVARLDAAIAKEVA